MKNNKGLTLVELLGVLVVLSLIIMIVTPVVTKNLKASQVEICEHQLNSLVAASKNWFTDQINDNYSNLYDENNDFIPTDINITGKDLLNQGYVAELEKEYYDVNIQITKDSSGYVYTISNKNNYCK